MKNKIHILIFSFIIIFFLFIFQTKSIANGKNFPFGVVASPAKNRSLGRNPQKAVKWLKELGVRWVRIHWAWKKIEPQKGIMSEEELARYDKIINLLNKERFNIVLLLGGIPSWSGEKPRIKKKHIVKGYVPSEENLKKIVQFIIKHYKGKVQYYQILNETTLPAHWIEPEEFAQLMKVAYQTAKDIDPSCKIIMGGFGTRSRIPKDKYLERFLKAGGGDFVDVFDFHMYNYISRIFKEIPVLRDILNKYKLNKPIWILETGDPSNFINKGTLKGLAQREEYKSEGSWDWPNFFNEEVQARRLVKRMVLALAQGVEKIFWYSFQDRIPKEKVKPTVKKSGHKNTKGLLYTDFTPKKSFYVYKFLISQLATAQFVRQLDLGNSNCLGFLFKDGKRQIIILWSWEGRKEVKLEVKGRNNVQIYDKLGSSLITASKENGFRIFLTPDPVYLVVPIKTKIHIFLQQNKQAHINRNGIKEYDA